MRIAVFGAGLVGRRTSALLSLHPEFEVVLVSQTRSAPVIDGVTTTVGWPNQAASEADVVVLAIESSHQYAVARQLINAGVHVVSTADDPQQVERLWALDDRARDRQVSLVVGAAYSPGVSTVLANYLARQFDEVSTIGTAQFGTGGPACAREHHRAMSGSGREVHRGLLRLTRGGSGRELVWFPDPVGAADCYRAALADPFLLHQAFPAVRRIESRQAATRRDRLTARLPMLRPPHAEGLVGAVWAEVRGRVDGRVEHRAMAASGAQASGAAAMAAAFCRELAATAEHERWDRPGGVLSAATVRNPVALLRHISKGVRLYTYDGSHIVVDGGNSAPLQAARKWQISS